MQQSLQHKADSANTHHDEGRQGYTVRIFCPNGVYCLWQIAQNHKEAGCYTANFIEKTLFHSIQ